MRFLNVNKLTEYGLYLLFFLLPWQIRWIFHYGELNGGIWEYGTFSLYGTDILLIVLLCLGLFCELRKGFLASLREARNDSKYIPWFFIGLLELTVFLSIFWAQDWRLAVQTWLRLLEGVGLVWLIFLFREKIKYCIIAFVLGMAAPAILGIWQFLSQTTFAWKWLGLTLHEAAAGGAAVVEAISGRWLRSYGSFPHPNIFAGYLVMAIFLCFWLFKEEMAVRKRAVFLCLAIIFTTALFFTFSRAGWLAFLVGMAILIVQAVFQTSALGAFLSFRPTPTHRRGSGGIPFIAPLLVFLLLTTIFWNPVLTRLAGQERLEVQSTTQRLLSFQQAKEIIQQSPLFGVGAGNYTLALAQLYPQRPAWDYQPAHNLYLLIFSEIGLVGFLFFILLFFYPLIGIIKKWEAKQELLIPVILLLTLAFFDHYFWSLRPGIFLWWLIFGLFWLGVDKSAEI